MSKLHVAVEINDTISLVKANESTGFVKCGNCEELWCDHIKKVVIENLDSSIIWHQVSKLPEDEPIDTVINIQVPIYPSANKWGRVWLQRSKVVPAAVEMYLDREQSKTSVDEFIGYLNQGDGRGVMRGLLFDWFEGAHPQWKDMTCGNAGHSFQNEMAYQQNIKNGLKIIEAWSIFTDDGCLSCTMTAHANFDDLIPDLGPAPPAPF